MVDSARFQGGKNGKTWRSIYFNISSREPRIFICRIHSGKLLLSPPPANPEKIPPYRRRGLLLPFCLLRTACSKREVVAPKGILGEPEDTGQSKSNQQICQIFVNPENQPTTNGTSPLGTKKEMYIVTQCNLNTLRFQITWMPCNLPSFLNLLTCWN